MAFPTIPTVAASRILSNVQADTAATRTFPSLSGLTKNSGDLLIAICIGYQTGTGTNAAFSSWSAGWTEFHDSATSTTMAIGMAYKWSTGSETGTIAVTQAGAITGHASMMLLSIPGAHATTPPEAGSRASGTGAADPAAFNPAGWDVEDTLWIAVGASGETSLTGSYTGLASAPTNYTDYADTGMSADAIGAVEGAVAFRQLNASSEDVGTFSGDTSNARDAAVVIAVRPAPVTLFGIVVFPITFAKVVSGSRKTFSQIAAPFTFVKAVAGFKHTNTSVAEISLASHGTPSARTNHSIKIRARTTTGSTGVIRAALYEGATNRSGDITSAALTTTLADYTLVIPDASAANITDYSNLSIRFWGYDSAGNALVFEIANVKLNLPTSSLTTYYGIIARATTFVKDVSGSRKTFGQIGAPFTFGKSVSGIIVAAKSTSVAEISFALHGTPSERTNHTIKIKARTTSGSTGVIKAALYEGVTNRSGDLTSSVLSNILTEYTLVIPDASAANITSYSDLSVRLWGYDAAGNALVFEVANVKLNLPTAVSTTYYGVVARITTFTKDVLGSKKTFGSVVAPFAFIKAVDGSRKTFGQVTAPFIFTKVVSGSRKTFGQVVAPFIFAKDVLGSKKTFGSVVVPFAFSGVISGSRKTFGQVAISINNIITTSGIRVANVFYGIVALPVIFSKAVIGQRKTFGQVAAPITFTKVFSGSRKTFSAVVAPFLFVKDVAGSKKTFGQVVAPFTFVKVVSASKKTFGQLIGPFIFSAEIVARLGTYGQVDRPFNFIKDVIGQRKTFSQVDRPLTFTKEITGSRKTFSQIDIPLIFSKDVIGQRTTFSSTVAPFIFSKDVSGRRVAFGEIALPLIFSKDVSGHRTTFGQLTSYWNLLFEIGGFQAGTTYYGITLLPMTFGKDVVGYRKLFGEVDLPINFTRNIMGQRTTFGQVPFSIIFDKNILGQRTTFGQLSSIIVFLAQESGYKSTFAQVDSPFAFMKDVSGRKETFGQLAFPITNNIFTSGIGFAWKYGQIEMPLVLGKDVLAYRETFGQSVSPYFIDSYVNGSRTAFGEVEFLFDLYFDVETGSVHAFSAIDLKLLLGLETAGLIRLPVIILNQAGSIYLGSKSVDAVYTNSQKVWPL